MSVVTEKGMKALYFAWVRERVGTAEEELNPPSTVETVGDLIAWLRERGEGYADRKSVV